nr:glyoxysomal fatty acid beta-oxidation multifunctional protein MFP-A [Ipomoea batatas]
MSLFCYCRRSLQLTSYKLKCDKEPLNSRQSENATEQSMSLGLKNGRLGKYMEYRLKVHNWLRLGSFLIKGHVPGVTDLGLAPRQIKKVRILVGGLMGSGIAKP